MISTVERTLRQWATMRRDADKKGQGLPPAFVEVYEYRRRRNWVVIIAAFLGAIIIAAAFLVVLAS